MDKHYIKHLIECHCVLTQLENVKPTIFHKFIVFSEIKSDGGFKSHYAKCNNCDAIHKVIEVGLSKRVNKETTSAIPTKEEILGALPSDLVELLKIYKIDFATLQEIKYVYENNLIPNAIILTREEDDGIVSGKILKFYSKTLWKIETFYYDESENDELDNE